MCIDARFLYVFVSLFSLVLVVSDCSNVPSFTSTRRNCNFTWMMNQIMPCTNDDWKSLPSMWQRGLSDSTCVYRDSPKPLNSAVLHGCLWLIFMCVNPPFQLNKNKKKSLRLSSTIFHPFSKLASLFGITAIPHLLEDSRCECRYLRLKIAYDLGGLGWDP